MQILKIMQCRIGSQCRDFRSGTKCEKQGDLEANIGGYGKDHECDKNNSIIEK